MKGVGEYTRVEESRRGKRRGKESRRREVGVEKGIERWEEGKK